MLGKCIDKCLLITNLSIRSHVRLKISSCELTDGLLVHIPPTGNYVPERLKRNARTGCEVMASVVLEVRVRQGGRSEARGSTLSW